MTDEKLGVDGGVVYSRTGEPFGQLVQQIRHAAAKFVSHSPILPHAPPPRSQLRVTDRRVGE
ncbi:hypothetical protein GCM10020360_28420 [Nonlabens tegetincola]